MKNSFSPSSPQDLHQEFIKKNFDELRIAIRELAAEHGWTDLPEHLWKEGVNELENLYGLHMLCFEPPETRKSLEYTRKITKKLGTGERIETPDLELAGIINSEKEDILAPYKILSLAGRKPNLKIDVDSFDDFDFLEKLSRYSRLRIELDLEENTPPTNAISSKTYPKTPPGALDRENFWVYREKLIQISRETPSREENLLEILAEEERQSYQDLEEETGLSKESTIPQYISALEERGLVKTENHPVEVSLSLFGELYCSIILGVKLGGERKKTSGGSIELFSRKTRIDRYGKPPPIWRGELAEVVFL